MAIPQRRTRATRRIRQCHGQGSGEPDPAHRCGRRPPGAVFAVQPADCAGPGYRQRALGVRPGDTYRRLRDGRRPGWPAKPAVFQLPRRCVLGRPSSRYRCALPAPAADEYARPAPGRGRRARRRSLRRLWRSGHRRSRSRGAVRRTAGRHWRSEVRVATRGHQRRGRARLGSPRQPPLQRTVRCGAGLRCPHRRASLDLGPDSARRIRPGLRRVDAGSRRGHGRRQRLGTDERRRRTRSRLPADLGTVTRLLRRHAPRRQPLRRFDRRAARCDRRSRLAFPDHSP